MLDFLWTVFIFIAAIAFLIIVHEYGHFIVARCLKVKVLRFSVGFGKVLCSFYDKKGTEYAVSALPLGGYVKMLDEREGPVSERDLPNSFNRKHPLSKIAIVLAGPLFNVLFAIVAYYFMFIIGVGEIVPMIGEVEAGSIAAKSGLQAGYEIVSVDQQKTPSWYDVQLAILSHVGEEGPIVLQLKDPKTGKHNTKKISTQDWGLKNVEVNLMESLGIIAMRPKIPLMVNEVLSGGPADQAGILEGDLLVGIDGQEMQYWSDMIDYIEPRAHEKVTVAFQRDGQILKAQLVLEERETKEGEKVGFMGIKSKTIPWPDELRHTVRYSPVGALIPAVKKTWNMAVLSLEMLWKMVVGDISPRGLSGPIGIAQGMGTSASMGLSYFISFLALISISLAIINILPIPLLDGGHLVFYIYELIAKKPVSERFQAISVQVGLYFLLAVMVLAFYNDLSRW